MAGAVVPKLLPAMLVPRAWRELWAQGCHAAMFDPSACSELWARGCRVAMLVPGAWRELYAQGSRRPCWFPGHGGSRGPGLLASQFGSQGMADTVVPRLPNCYVVSQVMAGAVGLVLPSAMLVPRAWREVWALGQACGHVGSRGMAGAVGPRLLPTTLVLGSWWELWAWGSQLDTLVPRAWRDLWALGQSGVHVNSRGVAGAVGLGLHRPCWFPGHGGSCGPGSAKWPCWF